MSAETMSARWLQWQIPSEDLAGHRDKTTRTRQVLCSTWPVLQPRIKPCHAGLVWPEDNCPQLCLVAPKVFYIYIYAFSRRFNPKRLTIQAIHIFVSTWMYSLGIKPTTFALLTQCSTTEPQEHFLVFCKILGVLGPCRCRLWLVYLGTLGWLHRLYWKRAELDVNTDSPMNWL